MIYNPINVSYHITMANTEHKTKGETMSSDRYQARIRHNGRNTEDLIAMIVRVYSDGEEQVSHCYGSRFFKTRKAAERSVANYIKKHGLND